MHLMRPHARPWLFGMLLAVAYGLCVVLAALRYPGAYGPLNNNTLSQLGNSHLNPHGAIYYLVGCALAGALAVAFFISLHPWRDTGSPLQNRLLFLVQALGVAGGVGLFMNAVYPENQLQLHHFWAGVVFNGFAAAMILAPFALHRGKLHLGLTVVPLLGVVAVIVMFIFARTHWVEWLPVTLFLLSPSLLGFHTKVSVLHSRGLG